VVFAFSAAAHTQAIPAFPGAEGAGTYAKGGADKVNAYFLPNPPSAGDKTQTVAIGELAHQRHQTPHSPAPLDARPVSGAAR